VWVGKNYSLAQLKADVRAVNPPHTDWPSKEPK
jgi:hypothetical protein